MPAAPSVTQKSAKQSAEAAKVSSFSSSACLQQVFFSWHVAVALAISVTSSELSRHCYVGSIAIEILVSQLHTSACATILSLSPNVLFLLTWQAKLVPPYCSVDIQAPNAKDVQEQNPANPEMIKHSVRKVGHHDSPPPPQS